MTEDNKARSARWRPGRYPASRWWLVTKEEPCTEALLVDCGEQTVLPVFSNEGEAEMFVWFESGWRIRETSGGELISVLRGPCADVESVALDPCPEMMATASIGLVSLGRERFISWIVERSMPHLSGERAPSKDRVRSCSL